MSDRIPTKSVILLWVTCLAVSASVPLLFSGWGAGPASRGLQAADASDPRPVDAGLERLEAEIARLADRVRALEASRLATSRRPVATEDPEPAEPTDEVEGRTFADLSRRLARLEQFERVRQDRLAEQRARQVADQELRRETELERRDAAHAIILDPERSDSEKAQAWLGLSRMDGYPWTDEVVAAMVEIGATSTDDRAREVVWIGADTEHRNDLLVRPLLAALHDPVANVREEAADALGHYLDFPGVREALRWSRDNDPSEKVRKEALRVLTEGS